MEAYFGNLFAGVRHEGSRMLLLSLTDQVISK